MVVAKWKDRRWYVARVVKRVGRKVHVTYLDGDRENVSLQHILPLVSIVQWKVKYECQFIGCF